MRLFQANLFLRLDGVLSKTARARPSPPPAAVALKATTFPTSRGALCSKASSPAMAAALGARKFAIISRRLSVGGAAEDEAVVAEAVAVLSEQRRRSRWGFLKAVVGGKGLTSEQAGKIITRLKNKPRLALRFFHWSEASSLCLHDLSSYAPMAHVLARGRLRRAAVSLLRAAVSREEDAAPDSVLAALLESYRACDSTPLVLDLLVRACVQARQLDHAMRVVRQLRARAVSPAGATCNELVRASCGASGAAAGLAVYGELFGGDSPMPASPDVQTFNSLLLALHREGRVQEEDADRILREMERRGCRPDCFTFCVRMAGLCAGGRVAAAEALFAEMAAVGIKPDAAAYNTLIGSLCLAGEIARAEELFRRMATAGVAATAASYEQLIAGHSAAGDATAALGLYEEMSRRGLRPEPSAVARLVGALCEKKRVTDGLGVLRKEMERTAGGLLLPCREMFVSVIEGLCDEGRMQEALELQAEMAAQGLAPDPQICRAFLHGYLRQGDAATADKLFDEMRTRSLTPPQEPDQDRWMNDTQAQRF
ncbi:tetratricopeptide repeat (TPR)-like superfamily protein [Wolffia australiana]